MKKWILMGFLAWAFSAALPVPGYAAAATTQVDALIAKLIEKGILTKEEAENLKGQIAYDAKTIQDGAVKSGVPEWVQNTKIGGDMRVRFQEQKRKNGTQDNAQGRMRMRLNLESKLSDKAKVVIGIATTGGANNARSNNVTFSGDTSTEAANKPFAKTTVVLNKAYGVYAFNDNWSATAGKMDNPIWEPMEFLWDADITPEGGSVRYDKKINDKISLFTTGNLFMLNNFSSSTSDPFVWVAQGGVILKPSEKMDAKLVGTYQGYGNIKNGFTGGNANNTNGTNEVQTGTTALKYDYSAPMYSGEIGFNDPFGELLPSPLYIPRVGVFGEYTKNPGADGQDTAWMAGAYLGNSKVSGFGTWKATWAYKWLGKDAWLDILPDSDFYSGNTDVKGYEGILEMGLSKNMTFVFDYYQAERIKTALKVPEHLLQADINWKF